jgi:hypothetical protein
MKNNNTKSSRIKVSYCQKGGIFAMSDKEPTGNYIRHNYLVMSDVTDDTETVVCFGITTARNGRWDNMVPLTSSNDVKSYIDLNKVYMYKRHEFANGHYHGNINSRSLMKTLTSIMKLRLGLLNREKFSIVLEKMKEVTVSLQDGVVIEDDPILEEDVTETVAVVESQPQQTETTDDSPKPEPVKEKVSKKQVKKEETLVGIFPFRTSSWTDEQLLLFTHEYEAGNYNNCRNHIKSATEAVLLKRYEKAVQELDKRGLLKKKGSETKEQPSQDNKVNEKDAEAQADENKQPVKTFSQKAKRYSPSFWTKEELELFAELYTSEEGKSVLKSEFGLTTAGLIAKNTEVSRRLGKASYNSRR